jgi:hypothetical protein
MPGKRVIGHVPQCQMRRLIRQSVIGVKPLRLLSSLVGYPVRFPRFSPVYRKRLLEVWRIRVDA